MCFEIRNVKNIVRPGKLIAEAAAQARRHQNQKEKNK
jgi:hypothetical protein